MFKSNFTKSGLYIHTILTILSLTVFIFFLLQGPGGEYTGQMFMGIVVISICMIVNFGMMRYKQGRKMISILYFGIALIPIICLITLIKLL